MSTEQLMIMINEFVDGELPAEKEMYLFTELGSNDVAREYFKKVNSLKLVTNEQTEIFPSQLDSKILSSLKKDSSIPLLAEAKSKIIAYVSYLILFISLLGGYFLYDQNVYQEAQLEISQTKIERQQHLLDLIMTNQLAPVTVETDFDNEVVVQASL